MLDSGHAVSPGLGRVVSSAIKVHCAGNALLTGIDPALDTNSSHTALEIRVINVSKLLVVVTGF